MKLTAIQLSELAACANSSKPIWSMAPPHPRQTDADLKFYIQHKLIEWVGEGYIITPAGRQALKGGE